MVWNSSRYSGEDRFKSRIDPTKNSAQTQFHLTPRKRTLIFFKNKRVLVTGGTGFVGSHFVDALLVAGANVVVPVHERPFLKTHSAAEGVKADLTNAADCEKVTKKIDYLFHCAGSVASAKMTVTNPMSAITNNLILTARVLEAAWNNQVERTLIFSSGTTAYPLRNEPLKESDMWTDGPPKVYFGYGWMRRYLELLGTFVNSRSKMGIAICRPTAVYGSRDNFSPESGHVIPALIRRAVQKENPYVVWGTGDETRDFLHVTDLARGCLLLLEKRATAEPVNIGYGRPHTIKDAVELILRASGNHNARVQFDPAKPTTVTVRSMDTTLAKEWLGFEPRISFEDGINDTVSWYRSNYLK